MIAKNKSSKSKNKNNKSKEKENQSSNKIPQTKQLDKNFKQKAYNNFNFTEKELEYLKI